MVLIKPPPFSVKCFAAASKRDAISPEGLDHIYATALLQHTRFLADNFERAVYSKGRQIVRNPQCSIIRNRINIVFGVEPEDDISDTAPSKNSQTTAAAPCRAG
jgi:hypothetical protein